ncbi:hypothetical protein ACFMBG_00015 [Leisingera sp. D0M16]|uniref:hypothetical protein n=1 Tax=Leisingera coralii TaxID=3351347 RepID=UPI003B7CCFAF
MLELKNFKTRVCLATLISFYAAVGHGQNMIPSGGSFEGSHSFPGPSTFGSTTDMGSFSDLLGAETSGTGVDLQRDFGNSVSTFKTLPNTAADIAPNAIGDNWSIEGLDLTSNDIKELLKDHGSVYGQKSASDWLAEGPDSVTTWRDFDGRSVSYGNDFVEDEELWEDIQGITPFIMPVGPDGNTPSINPVTGTSVVRDGALVRLQDPTSLDWNGGLQGDTSCYQPPEVDKEAVGRSVNSARLQTVLLASMGKVIKPSDGGGLVYRHQTCSADVAIKKVLHCSGIVEPGGKTVWTAAHCLRNAKLDLVDETLRSLGIGSEKPCSEDTKFRAISLLGLTQSDYVVSSKYMSSCETIQFFSPDVVRVRLKEPLPWAPVDDVVFSAWRWPDPGELNSLLKRGRRLFGSGYPHTPVLMDISGGRLMGMEHCVETLAGLMGYYDVGSTDAERKAGISKLKSEIGNNAETFGGFGCTSLDTRVGGSGGPVFALDDDGKSLILIGLVSGASWTDFDMECIGELDNPLQEQCGVAPTGRLNVFTLLPSR